MIWILHDLDLLSLLLRGLSFSCEVIALGGLLFLALVARPAAECAAARARALRTTRIAAVVLAATQAVATLLSLAILHGDSGLPVRTFLSAGFIASGCTVVAGSLCIAATRAAQSLWQRIRMAAGFVAVLCGVVAQSHAESRLDHRWLLMVLTGAHHLGAAGWVGAMVSLLLGVRALRDPVQARTLAKRYGQLAIASVVLLIAAGIAMSCFLVGSWGRLDETGYGELILAKVIFTLVMLALGAANFRLVRCSAGDLRRLRCFSEAEIGLGMTTLLAAASLTALPPAVDLAPQDVVTQHQVWEQIRPAVPRMTSPTYAQLVPATSMRTAIEATEYGPGAVSDAMDRAWSEYNHHWAGVIVMACGLLALAVALLPAGRWRSAAQNWPLLFIGLAVFIVLRADPENWPLGPRPFWESFAAPDVLQHRMYALLITGFAYFEWSVARGRLRARWTAYAFPVLCAGGGAVLLTHSHGLADTQSETLIGLSHVAIAVCGALAGWGRWIELRMGTGRAARYAGILWPICLALAGALLLDYREL